MRILHITNWYYSEDNKHNVPFIKEHLEALNQHAHNDLVHIEVVPSGGALPKLNQYDLSANERAMIYHTSVNKGRIIEFLTWRLLKKVFAAYKPNEHYDLVNFVISYPSCAYINKINAYLKIPFVLTEHWTAYHFNFNLPEHTNKLDRIKRIFWSRPNLITVSHALANDIRKFAKRPNLAYHVVPNVVNECFSYDPSIISKQESPTFFMVNLWRKIKSPFIIFEAFKTFLETYPGAVLRVGGYGPLWNDMEMYVEKNRLEKSIQLIGKMAKVDIAREMNKSTAFVHAARYETFSVVTAEALCCGTPVIVSRIPAISEFVDTNNGILIDDNQDQQSWVRAMTGLTSNKYNFNRSQISALARSKFSRDAVGKRYIDVLNAIIDQEDISTNAEE